MVPHQEKKEGVFGTWTTTDLDGTVKEVGLYRSPNGTVERRMFKTVREAIEYGINQGYKSRTGISYSDFLAGKGE